MKKTMSLLAGFALVIGVHNQASADSIALSFTGGSPYTYVDVPLSNTIGWEFTLASPIEVTSLGFYDFYNDGLAADHAVSIWDTASATQIVSAVVTNSGVSDQGYYWQSVTPVTLAAGTYRIGAEVNDDDVYFSGASTITVATPVTYNGGVFSVGGFQYPDNFSASNNGRFGPNFTIASGTPPVPEPASMLLVGSGLAGLVAFGRKKPV